MSATSSSSVVQWIVNIIDKKKKNDVKDVFDETTGVLMVEGARDDRSDNSASFRFFSGTTSRRIGAKKPRQVSQPISISRPVVEKKKTGYESLELPREHLTSPEEKVREIIRISDQWTRQLSNHPFQHVKYDVDKDFESV